MIIHVDVCGFCLVKRPDGTYSHVRGESFTRAEAVSHFGGADYINRSCGAEICAAIERDEEITSLPDDLDCLFLRDATLPASVTALPEGLRKMFLRDTTLPSGITSLPEGLRTLGMFGVASLPESITALPEGLIHLLLFDGTSLPKSIAIPRCCNVRRYPKYKVR